VDLHGEIIDLIKITEYFHENALRNAFNTMKNVPRRRKRDLDFFLVIL